MNKLNLFFLLISIFIVVIGTAYAQDHKSSFKIPATNPSSTIEQQVAATSIVVNYNRPSVKNRSIFGDLVPYDKVWRTGSDASTKITFSTPVIVNGNKIKSGTYEVYTIPGKKEWELILQKNKSQWGSYRYKAENDVIRVSTPPIKLKENVETFTISFEQVSSKSVKLSIAWEQTKVYADIEVDLAETVIPELEALLKKDGRKPYFKASMFYFENDLDINRANDLMKLALEQSPDHLGMLYRHALILEKKGDLKEAIEASELSLKLAKEVPGELKEEYIKLNTALLARLR